MAPSLEGHNFGLKKKGNIVDPLEGILVKRVHLNSNIMDNSFHPDRDDEDVKEPTIR
jgi:hypothetical protein